MRKANLLRRALVALIVAAPLALGPATAGAQAPRMSFPGFGAAVVGTVVSTNAGANSFVADASVVGQSGGTTQVTITTSMTLMIVNGRLGSVADMTAGDKFLAIFMGSPSEPIQTLTAGPALAIFDRTPPVPKQLYGFVGTVTGVDTSAGTVSVTLMDTMPSTLGSLGASATFTVGQQTLILGGGSAGGSLSRGFTGFSESLGGVSVGDIVAGLVVAPQGETLAQVETQPLNLLLDFPALNAGSAASRRDAATAALRALIGGRSIHAKHKKHSKHHTSKKSHKHARRA